MQFDVLAKANSWENIIHLARGLEFDRRLGHALH